MAPLPFSRVVDVTVTRRDRFPTRDGFGIPLIMQSAAGKPVTTAIRTKVYGSMEEIAADGWLSADPAYQSALAVFSQNPRPRQLKIGFVAPGAYAATPSPTVQAELDAIDDYDSNWYWGLFTADFRDKPVMDDAMEWFEAKPKQLHLCSNDVKTKLPDDLTTVAARNKKEFDRTSVFYHEVVPQYPEAALVGYTARRDFDQTDTAYTAKFKQLRAITATNLNSAAVEAVSGFVPQLGLDPTVGHLANAYVTIGGKDMVVEGTVLSGAFIDEIHVSDWLVARTQEEVLAVLLNNDRVPYTDTGVYQLVAAVEGVMNRANDAGLIATYVDAETGDLLPSYEISVDRVDSIPETQRRQRIAPDIRVTFRYAGAIHYATVRMVMSF